MSTPTQSAIIWPDKFLPGVTDNFVSNEIIAKDITAEQIWEQLSNISRWQSYYKNCDQITEPENGPRLRKGDVFRFSTFGLPVLACLVGEAIPPEPGHAGRLAWSTRLGDDTDERIEVYHAWLVEDLEGNRVRVLTQESQIGKPASRLARAKPNRMLLGHQDWLDGLVKAVKGEEIGETNLESV
jgi:hypothetical protein